MNISSHGTVLQFKYCDNCTQSATTIHISQRWINDKFSWSISQHCTHCQVSSELDGIGLIEDPWRSIYIQAEGRWKIRLVQPLDSAPKFSSVKRLLGLTMEQLTYIKSSFDNTLFIGTWFEAHMHHHRLIEDGAFSLQSIIVEEHKP